MRLLSLIPFILLIMQSVSYGSTPITQTDMKFLVLRNDKIIGEHVTRFTRSEGRLLVNSTMSLEISFLSIPIYDFSYESSETWKGNQLLSVDVSVDDDGEIKKFKALQNGSDLIIDGDVTGRDLSQPFFTTNHWHYGVVDTSVVLNTLTGKLNEVSITNMGEEEVKTSNGTVLATRFEYSGDLKDTSVWYDSNGRWVKLSFLGRDKSTIEYICASCALESQNGS